MTRHGGGTMPFHLIKVATLRQFHPRYHRFPYLPRSWGQISPSWDHFLCDVHHKFSFPPWDVELGARRDKGGMATTSVVQGPSKPLHGP